MRRWDGQRWTGESRSLPPWAGPGGPSGTGTGVATQPPRRRLSWSIFTVLFGVLFVAVSIKAVTSKPALPPRTVFDAQFISNANELCRAELGPLRDARPEPGSPEGKNPGSKEKVAGQVDDVADKLTAIAAGLRGIDVQLADRADVDGWLAEWDRYIDIGHRYADAVQEEAPRQGKLVEDGARSGQRANLFAKANKLDDCTFT
jgi:hypothetical protein